MVTKKVIPIIPVKALTSWSFSRYSTYQQCPAKLKYSAILRLKEPENDAMRRGQIIHKLAEDYIKGVLPAKIPPELKNFSDEFKRLRADYKRISYSMIVEDSWATTKGWVETQWNNWNECWLRLKLDAAHHEDGETLIITDWKTGKFRDEKNEEYLEQLDLYALIALLFHDHINFVKPRLVYLDVPAVYPPADEPLIYTRADISRLKKLWEKRVKPMMTDTTFAPRPNNLCRFCHYRADNGGPCQY